MPLKFSKDRHFSIIHNIKVLNYKILRFKRFKQFFVNKPGLLSISGFYFKPGCAQLDCKKMGSGISPVRLL